MRKRLRQNNPVSDARKTIRAEVASLFGPSKLMVAETSKVMTPFDGDLRAATSLFSRNDVTFPAAPARFYYKRK